jgi:lipopolysaccharide transport system ATP-binding protein
MNDIVIQAQGIGKMYRIGATLRANRMLREVITDAVLAPWRRASAVLSGRKIEASEEEVWALKDVCFKVRRGEVLGIIGRNGAGKSTLLKVLSRIAEPTEGRVGIKGRVGSLLEVGTGFHPELSGRDNIFLNGAILGMTRQDIGRRFDDIVAFAETARFLDTPVKHYSSGMYMRLAFAVAAHMDPDVLIVDEVLAVGDAAFRQKCLGKMGQVASQGRTVLFVSHDLQSLRGLCTRCILLADGRAIQDGPTASVLSAYQGSLRDNTLTTHTSVSDSRFRRGSGTVRFSSIQVRDETDANKSDFDMDEPVRFHMEYRTFEQASCLDFVLGIRGGPHQEIVTTARFTITAEPIPEGTCGTITAQIPAKSLRPGEYGLYFWLGSADHQYDIVDGLVPPITIASTSPMALLGYDPSQYAGVFSIRATVVSSSIGKGGG